MRMLWILAILGIGTIAYLAIRGRVIRLQEEFKEALRKAHEQRRQSSLPSENMVKCPSCGTYLAPSQQRHCGKTECPYKALPNSN